MGNRNLKYHLVKIHYSYTVEEVAKLCDHHKNTVRNWIKDGLPTINDKRPILIPGHLLKEFLQARRGKSKRPCKLGELYCVRCRAPKLPAGNMADFEPDNEKVGNLIAICPDCNAMMNQRVSMTKLGQIGEKIAVTLPQALRHIIEIIKPIVNSDLK